MLRASSQGLCLPLPAVCGRSTTLLAQATCRRMGMASQAIRTASSSHHHAQHQHSASPARRRREDDGGGKELEETCPTWENTPGSSPKPREVGENDGDRLPHQTTATSFPSADNTVKAFPEPMKLPPPVDLNISMSKSRTLLRRGRGTDRRTTPKSWDSTSQQKPQGTENPVHNPPLRTDVVRRVYLRVSHPRRAFPSQEQPPANHSQPSTDVEERERLRSELMLTLAYSSRPGVCWKAYSRLLDLPPLSQPTRDPADANQKPPIPFALMHRLCRVLASEHPVPQSTFIRLHSVLTELHTSGGTIHLHEWNALINSTGRGIRRRVSAAEYETALSFYMDMTSGFPPGTTLNRSRYGGTALDTNDLRLAPPINPDIYTFTSLIHLAARTADSQCFRHACNLLEKSGFLPTRITHLALLPFFRDTKQFTALRSTLWKMEAQGLEIGIDGLNAFLSSYAYNGRHDVVTNIYRLLRYNVAPAQDDQEKVQEVARKLEQEEYIQVPKDMKPNQITYIAVLQSLAYQGRFRAMLTVFLDMVSSPNLDNGPLPPRPDKDGVMQAVTYQPTMAAYRSVFMGFARYGHCPGEGDSGTRQHADSDWNLENLNKMFGLFMQTPNVQPSPWVVHWILIGYRKTTGGDTTVLKRVWGELEGRFGQYAFGSDTRREKLREQFLLTTSPVSQ